MIVQRKTATPKVLGYAQHAALHLLATLPPSAPVPKGAFNAVVRLHTVNDLIPSGLAVAKMLPHGKVKYVATPKGLKVWRTARVAPPPVPARHTRTASRTRVAAINSTLKAAKRVQRRG